MKLDHLLADWTEYDNRKKKDEDSRYFSCTEDWEVKYLTNKIRSAYPTISEDLIKMAIRGCCTTVNAPRPRRVFVLCILQRLGEL